MPAKAASGTHRSETGEAPQLRDLLPLFLPQITRMVEARFGNRLRSREAATDLVNSVCGDLLAQHVPFEYRGEAQFLRWLCVVVENKVRARLRMLGAQKRGGDRQVTADPEDLAALGCALGSPSQHAMLREDLSLLDRAMARLPEHYREVLVRTRLLGQSHTQVAEALRCTTGAVRNVLLRALVRLAREMDALTRGAADR